MAKCLEGTEFVQLARPNDDNIYFMQVREPHFIGLMVGINQKDTDEIERFMLQLANGDTLAKVKGYSVFMLPAGTLDGEKIDPEEAKSVLSGMAGFALKEKMGTREGRYLRYKEGVNMDAVLEKGRYYKELRQARRAARMAQEEE